jgi:hypothetical protein
MSENCRKNGIGYGSKVSPYKRPMLATARAKHNEWKSHAWEILFSCIKHIGKLIIENVVAHVNCMNMM